MEKVNCNYHTCKSFTDGDCYIQLCPFTVNLFSAVHLRNFFTIYHNTNNRGGQLKSIGGATQNRKSVFNHPGGWGVTEHELFSKRFTGMINDYHIYMFPDVFYSNY